MTTPWRKSSYSAQNTECVEVGCPAATHTAVRDSKLPHRAHLTFTPTAWAELTRTLGLTPPRP